MALSHSDTENTLVSDIRLQNLDSVRQLVHTIKGVSGNLGMSALHQASRDFEAQINLYENIVGLNFNESEKVEKVILKADNNQLKYLRSLPLHKSQICVDGLDGKWGEAIFHIKSNYEFETQVLKMAGMVAIKEPIWLREKMKNHIDSMQKLYID